MICTLLVPYVCIGEPLAAIRRTLERLQAAEAIDFGRRERQAPVSTRYFVHERGSTRKKTSVELEIMEMGVDVVDCFFGQAQGASHFLALGPNMAV